MKQPQSSRIKDQRVDIKVGPEVYRELTQVQALLERGESKSYSMSEVVGLLCQWSQPQITEIGEISAKLDSLKTKRKPPKNIH